ncbi:MAG: hypothetical protein ACRCUU_05575, partial [Plesiomonas sp.]
KIAELLHFQTSLQSLSNACCGGPRSAEHCSILEALESSTERVRFEHDHGQGSHSEHVHIAATADKSGD